MVSDDLVQYNDIEFKRSHTQNVPPTTLRGIFFNRHVHISNRTTCGKQKEFI